MATSSDTNRAGDPSFAPWLETEQLRLISTGLTHVGLHAPVWSTGISVAFTGLVPLLGLAPWWIGVAFFITIMSWVGFVFYTVKRFEADAEAPARVSFWRTAFLLVITSGGIIWSAFVVAFWQEGNVLNQLFITLSLVTTGTAYLTLYASHWKAYLLAILPMNVIIWTAHMAEGGPLSPLMAILVPVYAISLAAFGAISYARIKAALTTRYANEQLARDLAEARDVAVAQHREAQSANQAKTAFLANMSHELRTPLNAILGFSEMIEGQILGPVGDARYAEYASDIRTSGSHLLQIINDLLDIAKIEAGKLEVRREEIEPDTFIAHAIALARPQLNDKRLELELDVPHDIGSVYADERLMRQTVLNLLSNAIKYSPEGKAIRVAVEARGTESIRITVADEGPGIPADKLARVFEPFEQVDNSYAAARKGTGLGLALVRAFVQQHGGRVFLESELGHGTTAVIDLPRGLSSLAVRTADVA